MNNYIILILFVIYSVSLLSCGSENIKSEISKEKDSVSVADKEVNKETHTNPWMGIWTDGGSENATFQIHEDSIYYVDHLDSYKYEIKKDSIHIFYPDYKYSALISFNGDTMIFKDVESENKYYPFRN